MSRSAPRRWTRDLAMGLRFAFNGGREGWIRTLFTAVGVGLGVALLLVTTALPAALTARWHRSDARDFVIAPENAGPGRGTLLARRMDQSYHGRTIEGLFVTPEGPEAPVPPGLKNLPARGEMAVSPALDELLKSDEGELLRERLHYEVSERIGDAGLMGPGELYLYVSDDAIALDPTDLSGTFRVTRFGGDIDPAGLGSVLSLLVVLTFVALLMPVVVFIAAAVRFGGDRRDRRLAALRLVGADRGTVRRIAAGEALAGSLLGLGLGAGFFLAARRLVGSFALSRRGVFPADLDPSWGLVALVALAVPLVSVAVALIALRGLVVEPLGVVRTAKPVRRRMWWRLLPPLAGLGLLAPLRVRAEPGGSFNQWQVSAGVILLLVGVTSLLPWLLERVVGLLSGGPVSWQLATRRLQVDSGTSARLVNGIAVAVAGAIALQLLFAGTEGEFTQEPHRGSERASMTVRHSSSWTGSNDDFGRRLAATEGVAKVVALSTLAAAPADAPSAAPTAAPAGGSTGDPADGPRTPLAWITVGTCEALRNLAALDSCTDGDAFLVSDPAGDDGAPDDYIPRPGEKLLAGKRPGGAEPALVEWTVPPNVRTAESLPDPVGPLRTGLLVTPSAAPKGPGLPVYENVYVQLDPTVADGADRLRNAAFEADRASWTTALRASEYSPQYGTIRAGLSIGATLVLIMIGVSLLVSQLEQLRGHRRLLAALDAFGTRRSILCLSVLWQTALPVALAMVLAVALGLTLGSVLLTMAEVPVGVDWGAVLTMAAAGAGVVVLVTALSLPALLRMMRPDGLRTE